jgi:autotransporter-associated beta strand protein
VTRTWGDSANWNPESVPGAAGASVIFSGTWNQGTNNVALLGSATTTIGSITMTNIGTGTTATTGVFNLQATAGTATLKLDSGGATQPVINYTTGGQFSNFINVVLAGSQGYEKTGAGVAQVSGFNNTYTGTTKITAGGVRFIRNANLGDPTSAGPIQLNGGALYLRSDAGGVALDDRAAFGNAPGANKRNVSVTAGTSGAPSLLNLEITSGGTTVLEITGNLTSSTSTAWFRKTGGGTLNLKGSANSMLGPTQFDSGTTNMSGTLDTFSGMSIGVSNNASTSTAPTPVLNWTGSGTVASGNASLVVNDAGASATPSLSIASGTLTVGNGTSTGGFYVGGKGSGTATVNGGLLSVAANKDVSLGAFLQYGSSNGNGTLNVASGTMRVGGAGNFYVGYAQTNLTASGTFAGTGTINLTGGVLETARAIVTATSSLTTGTGTINFNGGTLRASGSSGDLLRVTTANVLNGGAVIDTNTFDVTVAQRLLNGGSGGLTKLGAGTLTLTGSSTYTGPTTVSAGKLAVNGVLGSGSLSVAAAAWLAGSGTIGGPVVVSGTLSPGNSPGLLTTQSLDLQASSVTLMEIAGSTRGTTYDGVDIATSSGLTYGGSLELTFSSQFPDYTSLDLFSFGGSPAGTFSSVTATGTYGSLTFVKSAGVWTAQSGTQTLSFTESTGNVIVVPEPATAALGGVSVIGLCLWAARRRLFPRSPIA